MSLSDAVGLIGVLLMLMAYAAAQSHWLDPLRTPSLLMNLIGSGLVMASLLYNFNLAAFVMEASWSAVALYGLARRALGSR